MPRAGSMTCARERNISGSLGRQHLVFAIQQAADEILRGRTLVALSEIGEDRRTAAPGAGVRRKRWVQDNRGGGFDKFVAVRGNGPYIRWCPTSTEGQPKKGD